MKIISQQVDILDILDGEEILKKLEKCGRVCYKSEDSVTDNSKERFIKSIIDRGHESVLEHVNITVHAVTNRAIANELVRHRIASYSQESSRYCNYSKGKFDKEITVIKPTCFEGDNDYKQVTGFNVWKNSMLESESAYMELLSLGYTPDEARGTLPLDLKTEIIMTLNIRSWRNLLSQRTAGVAHYQCQELLKPLLYEFKKLIPILFDDIGSYNSDDVIIKFGNDIIKPISLKDCTFQKTELDIILESLECIKRGDLITNPLQVHKCRQSLLEKFKDNAIEFRCKTEEDATDLINRLYNLGLTWETGSKDFTEWMDFERDTVYSYESGFIVYGIESDRETLEYKQGIL